MRPTIADLEYDARHRNDVQCPACDDWVDPDSIEPDSTGEEACLWCRRKWDGVRCNGCGMKRVEDELYDGLCWPCMKAARSAS